MSMIENVCLGLAAIDIIALNPSKGRAFAYRSGRITFEFYCNNSRFDLHGRHLKCFVCVNPHCVDWSVLVMCNGFTVISIVIHSEIVLQATAMLLLVASSMHDARWSSSPNSANIACFSRLRLAKPVMIDLHNFSSS